MKVTTQDLKGHRALVTGASSGLGMDFAKQLAARGADLVIAARRLDRLDQLAAELSKAHGVRVETLKSDLSIPNAAFELYEKSLKGGAVTILVNNAGVGPYGKFLEGQRVRHAETVQLNSVALTELCHLFATHMRDHGKQSYICNVGSIASFQGTPNFAVYSSTKAYVRVFSEILAHELADTKISVTCLCPGGTYTEFSASNGQQLNDAAHAFMMTSEAVVEAGLRGMFARKTFVIPGVLNKLACLLPKLLPSGLSLTLAQSAMERSVTETAKLAAPDQPGKSR